MDIRAEIVHDQLCLSRLDRPPPFAPQHFSKRGSTIEWFRDAPFSSEVVRAALFKRARFNALEHFDPDPAFLKATSVQCKGFAWVSRDFYKPVPIECATAEMRWVLTDRMLRPLVSRKHLVRIREKVSEMKRLIHERGTSPKPWLPAHATLDADLDFVTKCSRAAAIQNAYVQIHEWMGQPADAPAVEWMSYVEHPVHESIDAQIFVVSSMLIDSQHDVVWCAETQEFVVRNPIRKHPDWFPVGVYWSCEKLARLNSERKNKSVAIEREFLGQLETHAEFFERAGEFLMGVDEACFYVPHEGAYPEFVDEPAGTDEEAYRAQCGFPVATPRIHIRRFFDVPLREPNDGVFSKTQWAKARQGLAQ